MKEKIYEEYGYRVDYLIYKKEYISFETHGEKYMLFKTDYSNEKLEQLNMIVNYLDNYAIFFHQIVISRNGFIFKYGNEKYVLIKPRIVSERLIAINEILKLSNININLNINNYLDEKIDFLEKYLANYENVELENLNYFIGLSENAISLFNIIGTENRNFIAHKRIYYNEKAIDFYNPLDIVLDYRSRDLAEYSKSAFMYGNNQIIINLKYLNSNDWISYFARIMFPSFYFDNVDKCIKEGILMDKKRISYLANSFETTIRELYRVIANNISIPYIDWLININNF